MREMKFRLSLLLFLSLSAGANSFRLPEGPRKFSLHIIPEKVTYQSETFQRTLSLNPCSLRLARSLNSELLKKLPIKNLEKGDSLFIDNKSLSVDPESFRHMDSRMLVFFTEVGRTCG